MYNSSRSKFLTMSLYRFAFPSVLIVYKTVDVLVLGKFVQANSYTQGVHMHA